LGPARERFGESGAEPVGRQIAKWGDGEAHARCCAGGTLVVLAELEHVEADLLRQETVGTEAADQQPRQIALGAA
jgi:hypothetical protein